MQDLFEGIQDLDELLSSHDLVGEAGAEAGDPPVSESEHRPDPIGYVTRELTGPDGSILQVEVPVYAASEGAAELLESNGSHADEEDEGDEPELEDLSLLLAAEDAD